MKNVRKYAFIALETPFAQFGPCDFLIVLPWLLSQLLDVLACLISSHQEERLRCLLKEDTIKKRRKQQKMMPNDDNKEDLPPEVSQPKSDSRCIVTSDGRLHLPPMGCELGQSSVTIFLQFSPQLVRNLIREPELKVSRRFKGRRGEFNYWLGNSGDELGRVSGLQSGL
ncbi:hypothetical protein M9H77_06912 [Catharanthus roseus]|uniref:Uncharacterized protein n=1 Tax=Catharanthus roseus TaxID=4058 RepID=A0ACC0BTQ1_CATRO|nr:hypothetical protein M9H77_06912 [Catharanthus roseus]